ncbi:hypothetical protein NEF87_000046 [Candidatus Lokiarchaeum ossiferum]|uniref:MFS transporter n=1 Tax=Candidatus Lokiarchaeum ossiferum TaxID=2951803 RepID=A0ABY6HK14_9ARCH|nr:hypothetical protein NEF87_000046 [Candidatus Lokiarchaeum sp. B-35]
MKYSQFYKHLFGNTLLWVFSLAGFVLFSYIFRLEMDYFQAEGHNGFIIFFPLTAFSVYYLYMVNTFTHNIKNSLLIPTESNIPHQILKFGLIWIDLYLYLLLQIDPMDNDLVWYFLGLNMLFLFVYFLSIKKTRRPDLDQYYLIHQKSDPYLSLLIMGGYILFNLISLWYNFTKIVLVTIFAFFIAARIVHFFAIQEQKQKILMVIGIVILTNMIFWLSASITVIAMLMVDYLSLPYLFQYIPTVFFGVHLLILSNLKIYNMCQHLIRISPEAEIVDDSGEIHPKQTTSHIVTEQLVQYSAQIDFSCPQCRSPISKSIIQHLKVNNKLFCPHCGSKITQKDFSSRSPDEIYLEHQKLLSSLTNPSDQNSRLKTQFN